MCEIKEVFQKKLGETIQNRRNAVHMTQEFLADKAGTSLENLKKIEQGRGMPSIPLLTSIADALGSSVDDLLPKKNGTFEKARQVSELESNYLRLSPAGRNTLISISNNLILLEKELKGY